MPDSYNAQNTPPYEGERCGLESRVGHHSMTRQEAKKIVIELSDQLPKLSKEELDRFYYAVDNCDDAVLIAQARYLLSLGVTDSTNHS